MQYLKDILWTEHNAGVLHWTGPAPPEVQTLVAPTVLSASATGPPGMQV